MEKLFIICTFDCSFQYYEETVEQWVKEQGDGIVIDYELVRINDNKSHSFYNGYEFRYVCKDVRYRVGKGMG